MAHRTRIRLRGGATPLLVSIAICLWPLTAAVGFGQERFGQELGAAGTAVDAKSGASSPASPTPDPTAGVSGKPDASGEKASPDKEPDKKKQEEKKKKQEKLAQAAAGAYKILFYDNDFRYLDDPDYQDAHIGEGLKRLHACDCLTLDFGGQYRQRYMHEQNIRGLGLTGRDDDFLLQRTRLYGNLEATGWGRAYVEYLDADSSFERFPARGIEENRSDLLNAFGDLLLWEDSAGKLWGRVGRQELLYGSERVVSPLDWANTRRTFDGAKLFWRGKDWDIDGFWTQPVFPDPKNFDRADHSQEFLGVYATHKQRKHEQGASGPLDFYFLRYAEYEGRPDFDFNTFGSRYQGDWCDWLCDLEGAYQFGKHGEADVSAGFFTIGLGRRWADGPGKPSFWVYYDWASGDPNRGAGYNQLFPLAHKFLGYMDLYGRRNIEDLNFQLNLQPHREITFQMWHHIFWLQNGNDIPYSVAMTASPGFPPGVRPGGSRELGQELDLLMTCTLTARTYCQFGYSHFWSGAWFRTNPTPGLFQGDGDFFYTQWWVNF